MKNSNLSNISEELENSLRNSEKENGLLKSIIEKQDRVLDEKSDELDRKNNVINILKSKIQNKSLVKSKSNKIKQDNDKIITLKQNDKILNKIVNTKQQRHVKEPVEPIFKDILKEFRYNYAKTVVSKTTREILKLNKDEF